MQLFATVRARLTLWYSAALALPLIAFALFSYGAFARSLINRTDGFLNDALTAFTSELAYERRATSSMAAALTQTAREVQFRETQILIFDSSHALIASSAKASAREQGRRDGSELELEQLLPALRARAPDDDTPFTLRDAPGAHRVMTRTAAVDGRSLRVVALYPLRSTEQTLATIRQLFAVSIPVLALCAALGAYAIATRAFRPVAALAARASDIGASTLHERLPVQANDEIGDLTRVLNALLDRLEASFAQQRRFIADAAHELRTPTAIVRTEADVILSRPQRSEAEYRESVGIMHDVSKRLTRLVDDLFLASRADAGQLTIRRAPLYLDDLVQHALKGVRQLADRRQVQTALDVRVEAPVDGDEDLLGRVVLNLLDNAIKHAPPHTEVRATVAQNPRGYEVSVVNAGPEIPHADRDRIFQRFVRLDKSRGRTESSSTSGAGLGLGIARQIAEAHGGTLELRDSREGHTEFALVIPAGSAPAH